MIADGERAGRVRRIRFARPRYSRKPVGFRIVITPSAVAAPAPNNRTIRDRLLLGAISRGEFIINGFRNKDLQGLLYATIAQSVTESRRRSAAVNRKLRILRDHGLIQKSYRYKVTTKGRSVLTALIAAFNVTVNTLIPKAA